MDYGFILNKFKIEFYNRDIRSFTGDKVRFPISSIKHAFYKCPPTPKCSHMIVANKMFSHCAHSKDNCQYTAISEGLVAEIPTIRKLVEGNLTGKVRVYRTCAGEHVYIYGYDEPYLVVVFRCDKKKKEYIFQTVNNLSEKQLRKDILNCDLIEENEFT